MTTTDRAGEQSRKRLVYRLEGTVIEAVGGTLSPGGRRRGGPWITTWIVSRGDITGTDISGLVIIAVRQAGSYTELAPPAVLLLDERATPQQVEAVRDAFEGRHGGPLAGVFAGRLQPPGFYLVPMELGLGGHRTTVVARDMLAITIGPGEGREDGTGEVWVSIPEHHLRWRAAPVAALRANFRFGHPHDQTRRFGT